MEEGEAKGVYCLLCRKHHSKSTLNKTCNTFIDLASKRYKLSALSQHSNSGIHNQSIKNEHLQKLSVIHKDYEEKVERHNTVLEQAFSTCYFLMKEHMPNRKFVPLLEMIESQIGVSELKHFSRRSKGSVYDIFVCIW